MLPKLLGDGERVGREESSVNRDGALNRGILFVGRRGRKSVGLDDMLYNPSGDGGRLRLKKSTTICGIGFARKEDRRLCWLTILSGDDLSELRRGSSKREIDLSEEEGELLDQFDDEYRSEDSLKSWQRRHEDVPPHLRVVEHHQRSQGSGSKVFTIYVVLPSWERN